MKIKELIKSHKFIIVICLLIFGAIIISPPLAYNYIYPNASDDTAHHLQFIDNVKNGERVSGMYWGQYIVAYPIIWLNEWTGVSIDTLFMWFNFITLILIGIVLFFVVKSMIGWVAGLVSLAFLMFCVPSVLVIFGNGEIYDLITLGILMPLFIVCVAKSIIKRKWWLFGIAAGLFVLCVGFHSMGIIAGDTQDILNDLPSVSWFFIGMIGIPTIIFILLMAGGIIAYRKEIKINKEIKIELILFGILAVVLIIGTFTNITNYGDRFGMELPFVLGFMGVLLFGVLWKNENARKLLMFSGLIVVVGIIPMLTGYLSPSSAITEADKQAITFVNQLDGEYFSCSPEVAPWIYSRFLNKTYKEGVLPYIERNISMTWGTNENCKYYWWDDKLNPIISTDRMNGFYAGDVEILVRY